MTAAATLVLGLLGCNSTAARRRLMNSADPLDRARGAIEASEARDPAAVPRLVDLLEDPDQAVRMYAILALRRLCGEDCGYRYYDGEPQRQAAVQRWREALRCGKVALRPATQPGVPVGEPVADPGRGAADECPGMESRVP